MEIEAQDVTGRSGSRDMNSVVEVDKESVVMYRFHRTSRFAAKTVLRLFSSSGLH